MRLAFAADEPADPDRVRGVLIDEFRDFLRAGGALRVEDWLAMNVVGREAALAAGLDVDGERVARLVDSLAATTAAALREARETAVLRAVVEATAADAAKEPIR